MDPHSLSGITDDPVKFEEAIRAFRDRVPMTDDDWDSLVESEREFAFKVAGVTQLELVADVYEAVARAISDGTTLEDFQEEAGPALAESWGGEDPGRLDTIFRTNVMGAMNAGRYEAATAPEVLDERPYWRFDGIDDAVTTDDICRPIIEADVVLAADDPWWKTRYPPNHFNCRSHVTTLTQKQADDHGITSSPPNVQAMPGFGVAPSTGGTDWQPDVSDKPGPLRREFDEDGE